MVQEQAHHGLDDELLELLEAQVLLAQRLEDDVLLGRRPSRLRRERSSVDVAVWLASGHAKGGRVRDDSASACCHSWQFSWQQQQRSG